MASLPVCGLCGLSRADQIAEAEFVDHLAPIMGEAVQVTSLLVGLLVDAVEVEGGDGKFAPLPLGEHLAAHALVVPNIVSGRLEQTVAYVVGNGSEPGCPDIGLEPLLFGFAEPEKDLLLADCPV